MMKNLIFLLFVSVTLSSCFEKDVFPDTPEIAFEDIKFFDSPTFDSLVLSFSFTDGNSDIGLDEQNDFFPPYHFADLILDGDTAIVADTSAYNPPYYKAAMSFLPRSIRLRDGINEQTGNQNFRTESVFEYQIVSDLTLLGDDDPRIGKSFCDDYLNLTFYFPVEVAPNNDDLSSVTFNSLIAPNENYYNLFIDFYEQLPNGEVKKIDFDEVFNACTDDFNSRLPVFDATGEQGTITYVMQSPVFKAGLGLNPVQVQFYIKDKALNESNVATTDFFFVEDITQ